MSCLPACLCFASPYHITRFEIRLLIFSRLIEKDYMERQDDEGPGRNVYNYVA